MPTHAKPVPARPAPPPTTRQILVTGASSGIGRAAAARLADAGHVVFAVARRASTLEMTGAMFAPVLTQLLWLEVIASEALLVLEHLAMFPLMFLIMLRRRSEYGGTSHG